MRSFVIAIASFVLFSTVVQAADDTSPVIGSFPANTRSQQTYLFMLKKNGLSIRVGAQQFCHDMGYGDAVKRSDDPTKGYWQNEPYSSDDGKAPGELSWVICQFPKQ
jgi:hypothetical protein